MKKVFLTGATGLLGNNVARELIGRGYEVTAMTQPGISSDSLDSLGITSVECDLLERDRIIELVAGHQVVIHVAAYTAVWPSRQQLHWDVNSTGTQNMIDAAIAAKVERYISVGSASSFGFGKKDDPGNEERATSVEYGLDYIDSKKLAQKLVIDAVKERGLPGIVVNPTFMIGPYDFGPSSGAVIIATAKRKIPGFSSGGKNWVYVKDVAIAICNGITKGRVGECYLLGNENLSYKEALITIAEVVGTKPPMVSLPDFMMKTFGFFGTMYSRVSRKKPTLSFTLARISCDGHYFSVQKAVDELDLPQTPFREAVVEASDWFKENGYL